jgi:glycerol-3-phosphate dehydrogenase (NAD(P)+)
MSVLVIGGGAFGTALAVALAMEGPVTLWARDAGPLIRDRASPRLPGIRLPEAVTPTGWLDRPAPGTPVLLALPVKALPDFLARHAALLDGLPLVACCKGVEPETLRGPAAMIADACPRARIGVLTGPSFAADIARGLPTALTLAAADAATGARLQARLSTPTLRLYRTTDVTGAELGGALKNVIAIAAGVVIGAGLGESARAALMTRGHTEIGRLATALGAQPETLAGLSGLGDLILTCTSAQSRNFRYGDALGRSVAPEAGVTVEGVATARAAVRLAERQGIDMPVAAMVAALVDGAMAVPDAVRSLMTRPLRPE